MADDISGAIDKIKEMLNSESGKDTVSSILGMLNSGGQGAEKKEAPKAQQQEQEKSNNPPSLFDSIDLDTVMKVTKAYQELNSKEDERVHLLLALKPYLSSKRVEKLDTAIKMVNLAKLGPIVKELNLF